MSDDSPERRPPTIRVFPSVDALTTELAEHIVGQTRLAGLQSRMFSLFLSGGSTPAALYDKLASPAYVSHVNWLAVELFFGDERCVPPDSELSNYKLAIDRLISKVPVPRDNVYRMHGELDPQLAAKQYGQLLKEKFHDAPPDLVLLGMGDDGHTASLFPGTAALLETDHRCVANQVHHDYIPKGTGWRITLTYPFLNSATQVIVLVTGAGKAQRLEEVLEGPYQPDRLPIQGLAPAGALSYFIDTAAAGMGG